MSPSAIGGITRDNLPAVKDRVTQTRDSVQDFKATVEYRDAETCLARADQVDPDHGSLLRGNPATWPSPPPGATTARQSPATAWRPTATGC